MLSRANYKLTHLNDPFNALVVFGNASTTTYRGQPLTREVIDAHRNELEMQYWVTAVQFGMRGRRHPGRYMEVRYEDLCSEPVETLGRVFDFLEVDFSTLTREWILENASTRAIGKWRAHDAAALAEATTIGEPLLRELGYL